MEKKGTQIVALENRNEVSTGEEGIDLVAFALRVLDHWKRITLLCVLSGVAAFLITLFLITPKYQSTAQIYVLASSDSVVNLSDLQLGTYLASDYKEVFQTREVCEQVISELNLPYSVDQLRRMTTIVNPSSTRILQITVESKDPEEASSIANAYSKVSRNYIAKVMQVDRPTVLSEAVPNYKPVSPSKSKNTVIGVLLCALICLGVELIRFATDNTVKSGEDLTRISGIPVIGQVPKISIKIVSAVKKAEEKVPGNAKQTEPKDADAAQAEGETV